MYNYLDSGKYITSGLVSLELQDDNGTDMLVKDLREDFVLSFPVNESNVKNVSISPVPKGLNHDTFFTLDLPSDQNALYFDLR
jgi:hypothetical protein